MIMWYSVIGCMVTLALSLCAAPLAAHAQQPTHVYRIGLLHPFSSPPPSASDALAEALESREMLGITAPLRYNDLDHSSATRTRRSPCMRVKLQLVMCSDEGQEETVTDVITLDKDNQRIEHLGLTLAEAKQLLSTLQHHLLQQQID